jgi:2-keto-4-pentenoate hydratase/2-oxohepta-3-ene-1,7-dioic acid hydratase in catechol pathway
MFALSLISRKTGQPLKNIVTLTQASHSTMSITFAFPPPKPPTVAIKGSNEKFPVHRIYCVGRNYADHVREMGGDPNRSQPGAFSGIDLDL